MEPRCLDFSSDFDQRVTNASHDDFLSETRPSDDVLTNILPFDEQRQRICDMPTSLWNLDIISAAPSTFIPGNIGHEYEPTPGLSTDFSLARKDDFFTSLSEVDDFSISGASGPAAQPGPGNQHTPGPYACAQCQAVFERSLDLEKHAINLGHQSYTCGEPDCPKTFPRRDTRRRHMNGHNLVHAHRCEMCGERFARKDKLDRHEVKAHCKDPTTKDPAKIRRAKPKPRVGRASYSRSNPVEPWRVGHEDGSVCDVENSLASTPPANEILNGLNMIMQPLRSVLPDEGDLLDTVQSSIGELTDTQSEHLAHTFAILAIVKSAACQNGCPVKDCTRCIAKRQLEKIEKDILLCREQLEGTCSIGTYAFEAPEDWVVRIAEASESAQG